MGFNIQQYEQAIAKNGGDNWSNATGYTKEELKNKIKTAKDTIEKLTALRNTAQAQYDEANARKCFKCGGRKEPSCDPLCWKKEQDKANRANDVRLYTAEINTAETNIPKWQEELDDLIEKEANTITPNTGGGSTPNTGGGSTPAKTGSKTKNYLIIGGAVLVLGVVGFFVFRKK